MDVQAAFSKNVLSSDQHLPALPTNVEFDNPDVGLDPASTSTVMPTSAYFDYAGYAADGLPQREERRKQLQEGQDRYRCQEENEDNMTYEAESTGEVQAGMGDRAQYDHGIGNQRGHKQYSRAVDNTYITSRNGPFLNGRPQTHLDAKPLDVHILHEKDILMSSACKIPSEKYRTMAPIEIPGFQFVVI